MDYELKVKVYSDHDRLMAGLQHLGFGSVERRGHLVGDEPTVEEQGELLAELGVPFVVKGRHEERHPEWSRGGFRPRRNDARNLPSTSAPIGDGTELPSLGMRTMRLMPVINLRKGFRESVQTRFGRSMPADYTLLLWEEPKTRGVINERIDRWFKQPAEQRPNAIVFGAGSPICRDVEFALHRNGVVFGDEPGQILTIGMDYPGGDLIYGRGWNFPSVASDTLAHAMVKESADSAVPRGGETPPIPVFRILPALTQTRAPLTSEENG